ncbi:MAG: ABC transporter permease [Marinilabiliales bacterium]|nr:ABC transporter permease [Marinilabiliales bacterium]
MSKIGLVLTREYTTRVRKRSFIIMTILMPALMAAMMILPTYFMTQDDTKERHIAVYDGSTMLLGQMESNQYTKYTFITKEAYDGLKDHLKDSPYYALLVIQPNLLNTNTVQLVSANNIPFDVKNQVQNKIKSIIEKEKMAAVIKETNIPDLEARIKATKTNINVNTIKLGESGEARKSSTEIGMILGYVFGFVIYMFILLYGQMVMQGVMEEKQSRIVEVIISSVKPFELMMGKIVGIALVGLTQLSIWIVLGFMIVSGARGLMPGAHHADTAQQIMAQTQANMPAEMDKMQDIIGMLGSVNFPLIIGCFIFFFIGGYLLYSSMYAAVGSAVDAQEDAQQFMMPIMLPIILAILVMMSAIKNPEGPVAFWFSIIPFTSPVVMMARIPFGVPIWQLLLSMVALIATFVGMVWGAGKIYRTGILMYGKKVSWKELGKWLTYRT